MNQQNIIKECQNHAQEQHLEIIQFLYYPNTQKPDYCQVWTDCKTIISDLFSKINMISIIYDKQNKRKFEKDEQFQNQNFIEFNKNFDFLNQFLNISEDESKYSFDEHDFQKQINQDKCSITQKIETDVKQENKANKWVYQLPNEQSLEQAGKSLIFNKVEGSHLITEGDFKQKIVQDQYILVDCPSFSNFRDAPQRDNFIEKYTIFLEKNIKSISKFFLVLKYDRIDTIKQKFIEMMKYFKPFLQQIEVIISYQSNCETSFKLQEMTDKQEKNNDFKKDIQEIKKFIISVGRLQDINMHVFKMNIEQDELRSWFKPALQSEFKQISLNETIFERINEVELKKNVQAISDQINKVYDKKGFNNQVRDHLNGYNSQDYQYNNQSYQNQSGSKNKNDQNQLGVEFKKILNLLEQAQIYAENQMSEQYKKENSQTLYKIKQIISNIGQKINK